jgi:hypothetical protein
MLQGIFPMLLEPAAELPEAAGNRQLCRILRLRVSFASRSKLSAQDDKAFDSSCYRWHVLQLVISRTLRTLYFFSSAMPKSF